MSVVPVPVRGAAALILLAFHARRWCADVRQARRFREEAGEGPPRLDGVVLPTVSILVAAWNEAQWIGRHIESVLLLRYPRLEYVLCAGGSDATLEVARRFERPGVVVIEQRPGEGKQRALERAFARASGEIVYLTDADCLLDDESFERILAPLLLQGETAASGASRPLGEQCSALATLQFLRERYVACWSPPFSTGLLGRNAAVRRQALSSSGALSVPARTGTDYRAARALLTAGYVIRAVPHSLVASEYPSRPGPYAAQQSRWLRNLIVHALATRDRYHVVHGAGTALAGLLLASGWLPAVVLSGSGWFWVLAMAHALLARWRQVAAGAIAASAAVPPSAVLAVPAWVLLDAAVWAAVPWQLMARRTRYRW